MEPLRLPRSIAELDGLFVALRFWDEKEEHSPPRLPFPEFALHLQRHNWTSIHHLRRYSQGLWRSLQNTVKNLDLPAIHYICQHYGNAEGLRDAGISALRNTLLTLPPNDLKGVFALASILSITRESCRKRQRTEEQDFLSIFSTWTNAIDNEEERHAFNALAKKVWPGVSTPLPTSPAADTPAKPHLLGNEAVNTFGMPCCDEFSLLDHRDSHAAHSTCATFGRPDQPGLDECQCDHPHTAHQPNGAQAYSDVYPWSSNAFQTPPTEQLLDLSGAWQSTTSFNLPEALFIPLETRELTPKHSGLGGLQHTKIVADFFRFLHPSSGLLFLLSGEGMTFKAISSQLSFLQEQTNAKNQIRQIVFDPLRFVDDSQDAPARALLSGTEILVERGCLQSVEETRDYLITVGKVRFHASRQVSQSNC